MKYSQIVTVLALSLLIPVALHAAQVAQPTEAVKVESNVAKEPSAAMRDSNVSQSLPGERQASHEQPRDFTALKHPSCRRHYMYLPQEDEKSKCYYCVQPGSGAVMGSVVTGGYTCRFMSSFPPTGSCPPGTTLRRTIDYQYSCNSANPIDPSQISCYQDPEYNFQVTLVWENEAGLPPGSKNGFQCRASNNLGPVCTAPGAINVECQSSFGQECCVFIQGE